MGQPSRPPAPPPQCRFCLEPTTTRENPFIEPCSCSGTVRYVHTNCLRRWIALDPGRNSQRCSICATPFTIHVFPSLEEVPPAVNGWPLFFLRNTGTIGCALQLIYYAVLPKEGMNSATIITNGLLHELFILLFLRNAGVQNWRLYVTEARKNGLASIWAIHLFLLYLVLWAEHVAYSIPSYALLELSWSYHIYSLRGVNARILDDMRSMAGGAGAP